MRKSEFDILVKEYYITLKLYRDRTRRKEQVQARAALMSALKKYMGVTEIGRLFEMNHATIINHTKKHSFNKVSWPGYAEKYDVASAMCASMFKFKTIQSRINSVDKEIKRLNRIKSVLETQLTNQLKSASNEQLQIQND